ncbi:MAG: 4-alpha-glucanotransferase, partial [Parasporobacterium sp.]|nr:4-alpha-glucanotransferase [Parasporobacterium sp.]
MQICHNSQDIRFRTPFGAVTVGATVTLNLYAPGCHGASVRLWQEGKGETMVPMRQSAALFSAKIKVPGEAGVLWYFFVINTGSRIICYGNNPESLGGEGCIYEGSQPPSFQITIYRESKTPKWYKDALVYQIFPDRFFRGADFEQRKGAVNLPDGWQGASRFIEDNWFNLPRYIKSEDGAVTDWQFFGGTLSGIREKIPYLKSLGVTALYLNPIFKATSNHRYDTADYMQVDPLLGDNESFRVLAEECRKNNIRIILDGVFSHTGADSIYFDKYKNYENFGSELNSEKNSDSKETDGTNEHGSVSKGAFHHEDSKFRSWYRFRDEAPGYECWWGVTDLPNVEETDPTYDIFICGPGGVLENWTSLGASGFRLDVADELPDSFIQNVHDTLKDADPENLLIGEVWEDASNKYSYGELRNYFSGDELDGTMNYPLRDNALAFALGKESAEMFCRKMHSLQENYPREAFYGSLNLIGGHDCERVFSVLGEYERADDDFVRSDGVFCPKGSAIPLDEEKYVLGRNRLKMLSVLQYTIPGVPCIYYGDEAGVQGFKDPDNRRTFPWGQEDKDILYHYRMLGLIYNAHPALKDGSFEILDRDGCLFIIRSDESETLLTIVNPSSEKKSFSEQFKKLFNKSFKEKQFVYGLELLTSNEITITETALDVEVPPLSSMIILLKEEAPKQLQLPKASGLLCHLSSLPEADDSVFSSENSDFPSDKSQIHFAGALGQRGRDFVDWLAESGFKLWQILPVNPVGAGDSPYFSPCVFAGETRYIDREELPDDSGFKAFCKDNSYWLPDWTSFVLDTNYNGYLDGKEESSREELESEIMHDQYLFFSQLKKLREYANSKGILLIGDLPIYAAPNSADLKAHPECFQLDSDGHLLNVGGVPPDYFSETGQYWSNPLYNWDNMKNDNYEWWYQRLRLALQYFDYIRLDHFRSFSEYFAIPEGH